ncbi:MAG: ferredoxin--NADP reductase [Candidatus Woesearchaeota archaeon]
MVIKTQAKLIDKQQLSQDVFSFTFEAQDNFIFKSGHFLNFILPLKDQQRPLRRAYSIASRPYSKLKDEQGYKKIFELCVKIDLKGQFTPILQNSELKSKFEIMGPLGLFTLKDIENTSISQVFIAAGTGIAPMRSFILDLLVNKNFKGKVILLFGVRTHEDVLFQDEFTQLAKKYSNFSFYYTLSRPDESYQGLQGYVQDNLHILKGEDIDIQNCRFYICGRTKMVDSVHEKLDELEVSKELRSHEKFG